ncbi:beta-glucosidase 13-like isoform X1 [Salvia splendens]|uniref:beta-glucosidase 13-like isoform X1 n=1 Tax=Salvia splendens TaxID=180675 RepID=UPI0011002D82|nr:beta-glucosidase 13-like isoform X1 [Salvia splendens]
MSKMASLTHYSLLYLLSSIANSLSSANPTTTSTTCHCDTTSPVVRGNFPEGFVFGAASSAYQYEGAVKENGKGQSSWDNFTHSYPEKIKDHSNGDVAIDSYHMYKEDVNIARDLGLDAYRISISWPRVLPGGKIEAGVNQDGIDYYNNLINELLANGIEPFVTLHHLDVPQALQDAYGGFLSSQIVGDFLDFANLLFEQFGDRVKYWVTINEPWTFSVYGYAYGVFAPARCSEWQGLNCTGGDSATEPYIVGHNLLLGHSAVVNLYREKYQDSQKGKIGIVFAAYWFEPFDETNENENAKDRAMDFMLGWYMEPLTHGSYPESMKIRVKERLPKFDKNEIEMVKGSFDFIGFNYYGAIYALDKPNSTSYSYTTDSEMVITGIKNGKPIGEQGRDSSKLYIYPKGLRQMLKLIKQKYNNPLIYITENGLDEARNDTLDLSQALQDNMRKDYIHHHLCCLNEAIEKDDANVKGYFVWSLVDNFEWAGGFSVRFGLYYVDYRDELLRRYPKISSLWFKNFLSKTTWSQ